MDQQPEKILVPFVTEELWGHLKAAARDHPARLQPEDGAWPDLLITARWPEPARGRLGGGAHHRLPHLPRSRARHPQPARREEHAKPSQKLAAIIVEDQEHAGMFAFQRQILCALSGFWEGSRFCCIWCGEMEYPVW